MERRGAEEAAGGSAGCCVRKIVKPFPSHQPRALRSGKDGAKFQVNPSSSPPAFPYCVVGRSHSGGFSGRGLPRDPWQVRYYGVLVLHIVHCIGNQALPRRLQAQGLDLAISPEGTLPFLQLGNPSTAAVAHENGVHPML